jgi:hypothetical protein
LNFDSFVFTSPCLFSQKILISFIGDKNNCWDYCFGREDQLSTDLVNIVKGQNLDGIDIDYEYCYDVAGRQAGRCSQRSSLYSDAKAQRFLNSLTSSLRTKLDILRAGNGYNRGRYELTHAPMDSDLARDSKYFGILRERRADLDFLMPQFYNGSTRAGTDGFDGSGAGQIKASTIFSSLANNLFDREPNKVVFGHCISDCSGTGSNVNANQAVQIQKQIKEYNNGEFKCNGGAFFWVANRDVGGAWSDQVVREVSLTSGCSKSQPTPTNAPRPVPTPSPGSSSGTCGNGNRGNGVCADGTCCSEYGWCGTSTEHCSGGGGGSPPTPSSGTCGNGNRGNGVCADGTCCSKYGWCGTSTEHCSGGGAGSPPSPNSGTCGNGNRGNGVCADGTCCSKYGWCGTSTEHCSGRRLRGNNNNTTEAEPEPELETEAEVEVFDDLIVEPNENDEWNNTTVDVDVDKPVIKKKKGYFGVGFAHELELEMAANNIDIDIDIDEPVIMDTEN